ncbi:protein argonaute MEL1-like [Rutidosis leptorrhynchoides]|uniref:protein argonaute MEL1-like n=1 Tax=Rutidosis leptorrhynchoides TaxID=125765 RepID=UPI003A9A2231
MISNLETLRDQHNLVRALARDIRLLNNHIWCTCIPCSTWGGFCSSCSCFYGLAKLNQVASTGFFAALQARRGRSHQILFVVLSEMSGSYGIIKKVCETELGIVSQCCHPKHVKKMNEQHFKKLALKVIVKVGSSNTFCQRPSHDIRMPYYNFWCNVSHP